MIGAASHGNHIETEHLGNASISIDIGNEIPYSSACDVCYGSTLAVITHADLRRLCPGDLNWSTQHFILEAKME
jgi:hypothetical protein